MLHPQRAQQYLDALYAETALTPRSPVSTIYLGGGTPNAYDAPAISALVARLCEHFSAAPEISIELNPELVRDGDFKLYRSVGITRLSIGVQTFEPSEIATLGRRHDPAAIAGIIRQARTDGIESVSVDLMFAVPGQSAQSWRRSLERTIALDVDHISTYGLTVEEGTPYARWRDREPSAFYDDGVEAELYAMAIGVLAAAGYEQYEISNFSRPGHQCAHNLNYWANGEYIGLGVGAASYREGTRSLNTRSLNTYLEALRAGRRAPSEAERLEGRRRVGEAVMLALRTNRGASLAEFKERYGTNLIVEYAPVVERYAELGLLEHAGDFMRLTERGRFLANEICGAFVTFD